MLTTIRHKKDRDWATHALFPNGKASVEAYAVMYKSLTADLIKENSYTINGVPGTRVDIVRSVISLVTVHWVADCIVSPTPFVRPTVADAPQIGIPLKTKKTPDGLFTEQEVADMLALLTTCGFLNVVPEHSWVLEHTALEVVKPLQQIIEHNLKALTPAKVRTWPLPPSCAADPPAEPDRHDPRVRLRHRPAEQGREAVPAVPRAPPAGRPPRARRRRRGARPRARRLRGVRAGRRADRRLLHGRRARGGARRHHTHREPRNGDGGRSGAVAGICAGGAACVAVSRSFSKCEADSDVGV